MEALITAVLVGASVSLIFFYFSGSFNEKKMINRRVQLLQEGIPAASAAKEEIYNIDFTHHKRGKSRNDVSPVILIGAALWIGIGYLILNKMGMDLKGILGLLLILPLTLVQIFKRVSRSSRLERFKRELPGALDLMVVCLEAGLSLNSALLRIANEMEGSPLGKELRRASDEIGAGIPFEDALRGFAKRTEVEEVNTIISAIIQAQKMGTSLAVTFRVQSDSLREKYKMHLREKINRVPIKILFPLVFFLFPALFVVILGPSLISVAASFKAAM